MIRRFALVPSLLVIAVAAAWGSPSLVHAETRVVSSTVENVYPGALVFHLKAEAEVNITDVSLTFTQGDRSSSSLRKPDAFSPATALETSVRVNVAGGGTSIPLATDVSYSWEIRTADGKTLVTPPETYLYMPPNREWQSVESPAMRIYYYGDRERSARQLLTAGQETYDRMATGLFGITLDVLPVRVVLFVTESEMNQAREGRSNTLDDLTQTCGLKVSSTVVYVIQTCNSIDTANILRHEFTHIINEAAGEGPRAVMPAWLDEGTAVYAQSEPGSGFESAINAARRTGKYIPFTDMALPASDPALTNLFYGQAWAMVDFLVQRKGPAEFAKLFALIKDGTRYDRAIQQVYGFDIAGFEAEFRAARGTQQQPTPTSTASPVRRTPTATAPTRAPIATSTSNEDDEDAVLNTTTVLIIGAAVLFALLAVFAYLFSAMLAANRRAAAATRLAERRPDIDQDRDPPPPPPSPPSDSLLAPPSGEPPDGDQTQG